MNSLFATWYIPLRMQEMGIKNYSIRFKSFMFQASANMQLEAFNELYFLIDAGKQFEVNSKTGVFNLNDQSITEMQFEHRGNISISNLYKEAGIIQFIQVIIHNKPNNEQ